MMKKRRKKNAEKVEKYNKHAVVNGWPDRPEKGKKPITGCKMVMCEDPLTGVYRMFPVKCPTEYVEKMKATMREKGVRFSSEPFPEDAFLRIPEESE